MLILLFALRSSLPCQEMGVIVWPWVMSHQCVHSPSCMRVYEKDCKGLAVIRGMTHTARGHAQPKLGSSALPSPVYSQQANLGHRTSYNRPSSDLDHQRTSRKVIFQAFLRSVVRTISILYMRLRGKAGTHVGGLLSAFPRQLGHREWRRPA
jgi:hypothetical protein